MNYFMFLSHSLFVFLIYTTKMNTILSSVESSGSAPNFTSSYYSVQFHVYRLLIAPSTIENLNTSYNLSFSLSPPLFLASR